MERWEECLRVQIEARDVLLDWALVEARINAENAVVMAQQLEGKVQDLSSFKTFEIVSLHSKARKKISLKQIVSVSAKPLEYSLEFRSFGLRKPVTIELAITRAGGEEQVFTYQEINPRDALHDRWSTFCICGTPWMFQGENWVQSPFIRDFVTLRVVGRQGNNCHLPKGFSPTSCTDGSENK